MATDEWGRDPGVRKMRVIFGKLEQAQGKFLEESRLSPFDARLKGWRRAALKRFESCWIRGMDKGMNITDDEAADLYVTCLAQVVRKGGVELPSSAHAENERIMQLMETDSQ
jgi:hypothetical protein